jgi:hypothetical protein
MADTKGLLSTSDNPWNPWTHFTQWNAWDQEAGYHTLAYLARVTVTSNELSQADQDLAYDLAVEEILEHNLTGNYVTVPEPKAS